ncbi:MAG TPA: bifunctional phosphoglucose/phosphomannose isomerase [Solirubrobacteraceae bacterium]|jgi:glucose/mannose-6-phosphate isomerase
MTVATLDTGAVGAVDSTGQAAEILDLPLHLSDALWRVESAAIKPADSAGGMIVAGMGGSGIGGRLAIAALGSRARRPITVTADYRLPPWATADSTVLCTSYSGTTDETLACYDAAGALGARRIVATTGGGLAERARRDGVPVVPIPGGFQPRAAVGYLMVVALEIAALSGAAPSLRAEVEAAAALATELAERWRPDGAEDAEPKRLARALDGCVPIIAGAELTAPVAYRWKTQLNENAKLPAFAGELPEIDHNEIVGWRASPDYGRFAAVLLDDPETDERTRRRIALTAELAADGAQAVEVVCTRGESRTERVVSAVLLGDLLSLYTAVLRGVDPVEIDVLDTLKARLSEG